MTSTSHTSLPLFLSFMLTQNHQAGLKALSISMHSCPRIRQGVAAWPEFFNSSPHNLMQDKAPKAI